MNFRNLSITRKLLSLLGGRITVDSTYGVGTRFTVALPSLNPAEVADRYDSPAGEEAGGSGRAVAGR